jgi:hypothetical protein
VPVTFRITNSGTLPSTCPAFTASGGRPSGITCQNYSIVSPIQSEFVRSAPLRAHHSVVPGRHYPAESVQPVRTGVERVLQLRRWPSGEQRIRDLTI